ncbi:MAG: TonB-dependent receptor [Holophagales bacterium]|jgi:hemoglobin/transferrin/lactoferrin receptor protein|nr:TonB-dependent receptor [Holophagales bacterium]
MNMNCIALLTLALTANPIMAQSDPKSKADDPPPQEVTSREIVVTATRTERELFDVPTSVSVVKAKQMERKPKGTIAQMLQDIPGIQVTDGGIGGGTKRVNIRGEGGARVLVLIDGIKISEQKSMDGSMVMIGPNNVERIELIKGPASVLYGSEAIGGVVNIITKKGGTSSIQGTQTLLWDGANNSLTPYTSLYGKHNGVNYRVSGDYTDAGDKIGASGRIDNSGYLQRNWSAYLDYAWNKGKVGTGYDHYRSRNRIPGAVSEEQESVTIESMGGPTVVNGIGITNIALDLPRWQRDRYYAFVELEKLSSVLRKIKFTPFIQKTGKDFFNKIDYQLRGQQGPVFVKNDVEQNPSTFNNQTSYGANLQTDLTLGYTHYGVGRVEYLDDDLDAKAENHGRVYVWVGIPNVMTMTEQDIPTSSSCFYKGGQQTLAAYLQDEWNLHSDLTATFGLRGTWFQSKLSDTNDDRLAIRSNSDSHVVGSMGIVYAGIQDWRLRVLSSTGYRHPILNQLYIGTAHGSSGYAYPNPALKPETSNNHEIGVRYDAHGVQGDINVFYATADNYITIRRRIDDPNYDFDNVESARTYGTEFTLSYTSEPANLTPYLAGTLISRTFDRGGSLGKTDRTGLPKWNGSLGLRYERSFTAKFDFYTDAFGRFAANNQEDTSNETTLNYVENGGWGTFNLALGARITRSGKIRDCFVDLNLNNIFNKSYIPSMSVLEDPGFNIVLRAGMSF